MLVGLFCTERDPSTRAPRSVSSPLAHDVDPTQAGQHPAQHDEIGTSPRGHIERGAAVGGARHAIAGRCELAGNDERQIARVFGQEDRRWGRIMHGS